MTEVGDYTGFPEMLDGRVKTLHPKVHGGILARRDLPEHMAAMESARHSDHRPGGREPLSLSAQTVARPDCTFEEAIENIDIGGPAMVRAAAKNYKNVAVVTDPADYAPVLREMQIGERHGFASELRFQLALQGVLAHRRVRRRHQQLSHFAWTAKAESAALFPAALNLQFRESRRICATAKIRTSRRRSIATCTGCQAALPATGNCRARNCRTTISPTPTPRGNA